MIFMICLLCAVLAIPLTLVPAIMFQWSIWGTALVWYLVAYALFVLFLWRIARVNRRNP